MNADKITAIARICHEANRACCAGLGDHSQVPWDETTEEFRANSIAAVRFQIENPGATAEQQHTQWMTMRLEAGWKLGPIKDIEKKIHPCLVPYDQLPEEQRRKDALFAAIVEALR
jgi:hypothetical protein